MLSADVFDPFKHTRAAPFVFVPEFDRSTTCSSRPRGCDAALPAAAAQGLAAAEPSSIPPSSRPQSPQRGCTPNVAWRCVSMQQLRAHPAFVALPPPWRVTPTTAADLRLFRQDSQQWSAIHAGRITTSACASCLGLYVWPPLRALKNRNILGQVRGAKRQQAGGACLPARPRQSA